MSSVEVARARREAGFTLVEMLTAMAVLGVVLTLVVQSYDRTMRLFRQGGQQFQQTRSLLSLIETLRGDINAAEGVEIPSRGTPEGNPETVLRTRTKAPGRANDVGVEGVSYEIEYRLEAEKSKKLDAKAPAATSRKRLVREVRRSGETTPVASRAFELELSQFQIKERVAAMSAPGGAGASAPGAGEAGASTAGAGGAGTPTPGAGEVGASASGAGGAVATPGAGVASAATPGAVRAAASVRGAIEIRMEYFITKTGQGTEPCTFLVERLVSESTGVGR